MSWRNIYWFVKSTKSIIHKVAVRRVNERKVIGYLKNCLFKKTFKWDWKWPMHNELRFYCNYSNGNIVIKRLLEIKNGDSKSLINYYFINYNFC